MTNSKAVGIAYSDPALDGATIANSTLSGTTAIDATTIGATTPGSGVFTSLSSTSGTLNPTSIGATTPGSGVFTSLAVGTSGTPVTVASGNKNSYYGTATNTSGTVNLNLSNVNTTGIAASANTEIIQATVASAAASINALATSTYVNAGGTISGSVNAIQAIIGTAASITPGGIVAGLQLVSDFGAGSTLPTTASFIRIKDTTAVLMPNLLQVPNAATNTIFRAKTSAAVSHVLKMISDDGTAYYIMVSNQA